MLFNQEQNVDTRDEPYGYSVLGRDDDRDTWSAFLFIDAGRLKKLVYKDLVNGARVTVQMLRTGDCLACVHTGGTLPEKEVTGIFPPSLMTPRGELITLKTHLYAIRPFIEETYLGFGNPAPSA